MTRVADRTPSLAALALLAVALAAGTAHARSDDRSQPMRINADDVDGILQDDADVNLSGNVRITQGTLDIRADRAKVIMRSGEISHVTLWGSPARLRQVDDAGNPMDASARQFDYDMSGDVILLQQDVSVVQPRGTITGEKLVYNLTTSRVNAGAAGSRVELLIQPRTAGGND